MPVRIRPSAFAPVIAFAALFAIFGVQTGLPLLVSVVFGGAGGIVSLLFHELGHIRAASAVRGVRPTSVSVIWAGAATTLEGRYRSGLDQVRVAVGGPQASFTLALSLIVVCLLPVPVHTEPLLLLAFFNIALGVVNLLPAYPLDGYKVATGLLWAATGSESKARRILRRVGLAWALIELPAAVFLVLEKPLLAMVVLSAALTLLLQKRLLPHVAR